MRSSPPLGLLTCLLALIALSPPARAANPLDQLTPVGAQTASQEVSFSLISSHQTVAPGQSFYVAIDVNIAEGFWLYSPAPGGKAVQPKPLRVLVQAEGFQADPALFPPPERHTTGQGDKAEENLVYLTHTTFYVPLHVPADAKPGGEPTIRVTLEGQYCKTTTCFDLGQEQTLSVHIGPTPELNATGLYTPPPPTVRPMSPAEVAGLSTDLAGRDLTLWTALPLALLAGLILNIMPCVLPVIPLKVLGIFQQARESRRRALTLGMAFCGGILAFFVGLAILNAVLRLTVGTGYQWGDIFKYPWAVIGLALLMVVLALNLFGVFTVSFGGRLASGGPREGHAGSVFMGFLAALLGIPCSFAILTAVLVWAQTQSLPIGTIVLLLIGVGMAAPYALLTASPRLLARLPKPGPWMEHFKHAMAFPLLAVAVWLIWVLGDPKWMARVAGFAVVLSLCILMAGRWVNFASPPRRRWGVRIAAGMLAVLAGSWLLPPPAPPPVSWQDFSTQQFEAARQSGKIVLIDFTADWCGTCKTVEALVYDRQSTADSFQQRGVVAFRGDVTRHDQPANALLKQLREPGIPVTVVYPPGDGQRPIRLHGIFSQQELFKALDQAATDAR